jgi:tRNA nucleotidyltransferase/poly(A) polymerase
MGFCIFISEPFKKMNSEQVKTNQHMTEKYHIKNFTEWVNESFKMSSIKRQMPIPEEVEQMAQLFKKAKFRLLVVGGAVRDFLSNKTPKDYDLTTDATPDQVDRLLPKGYNTLDIGKKHNVSFVIAPDGEQYEIATFREDVGKGRRPESVRNATIEVDALRRDLTINALYYDIANDEFIDLVGGMEDIKNQRVRTVGDPIERFDEDPLRKLRAIRFAHVIGGHMDVHAETAILNDNSLSGVSAERIRDEFKSGIIKSKSADKYVKDLIKYGFLDKVLPGFALNVEIINSKNPLAHIAFWLKNIDLNERVKLSLKLLGYEKKDVAMIDFIHALINFDAQNPIELVKKRMIADATFVDINDISNIIPLQSNTIKGIFDYALEIRGNDPRLQGLRGKELGD